MQVPTLDEEGDDAADPCYHTASLNYKGRYINLRNECMKG